MRKALVAALLLTCALPASAQTARAPARLPDWSGMWIPEGDETSIGGLPDASLEAKLAGKPAARNAANQLFGFGAPWNAEGQRRQAAREGNGNRKADGWGFPMLMSAAAPIQFFITRDKVLVINAYRDVTDIRIAPKHPSDDDLWPTVWGDSIGHWEGDTLVVDTIAVKNPNEFFHGAPPLSDKAHYTQRLHLEKPGRLLNDVTIDDPTTLTHPWVIHIAYVPAEGFERMVYDTYDNDRTDSEHGTIEPSKVGQGAN